MRTLRIIAILVFSAVSIAGAATSGSAAAKTPTRAKAARAIHITSPALGQTVEGTSVSIRYEVSAHRRASAGFLVQLDSQPPAETADSTYTFDQISPGQHTVIVELMDSKHRPIAGSQAKSTFVTVSPVPPPAELSVEPMLPPTLQKVAMFLPQAAAPIDPGDGSAQMPLLTVIGLGVLVGGMLSAMKTRT